MEAPAKEQPMATASTAHVGVDECQSVQGGNILFEFQLFPLYLRQSLTEKRLSHLIFYNFSLIQNRTDYPHLFSQRLLIDNILAYDYANHIITFIWIRVILHTYLLYVYLKGIIPTLIFYYDLCVYSMYIP